MYELIAYQGGDCYAYNWKLRAAAFYAESAKYAPGLHEQACECSGDRAENQ